MTDEAMSPLRHHSSGRHPKPFTGPDSCTAANYVRGSCHGMTDNNGLRSRDDWSKDHLDK